MSAPAAAAASSLGNLHVRVTAAFDYPVRFTRDAFAPDNSDILEALRRKEPARRHRLFAIIESSVAAAWPDLPAAVSRYVRAHSGCLELAAPPHIVEGGEAVKNRAEAPCWLQARLAAARMGRQAHLLVVGGGALLDMAGFAAATLSRGLRVTRLPTTLLAQSACSVGLVNCVNGPAGKDALGAFVTPFAVVIDARFLETLSSRDLRAGAAEAVKAALSRDAEFFDWIESRAGAVARGEGETLEELVRRSARLHLESAAGCADPHGPGCSGPLDLGHWSAYRLEELSRSSLRHGEALGLGLCLDAVVSEEVCGFPPEARARLLGLIEALGLPTWHELLDAADEEGRPLLLEGLRQRADRQGCEPGLTLLRAMGRTVRTDGIDEATVLRAVDALRVRSNRR